jgi:hypothetical protein
MTYEVFPCFLTVKNRKPHDTHVGHRQVVTFARLPRPPNGEMESTRNVKSQMPSLFFISHWSTELWLEPFQNFCAILTLNRIQCTKYREKTIYWEDYILRRLYTQKTIYSEVYTLRSLYTQKTIYWEDYILRRLYTQKPIYSEDYILRRLYTEKTIYWEDYILRSLVFVPLKMLFGWSNQ